jgi:acyl-CoA synthetase (AMP-forming)/AMP-acid ligase II
MNAGAALPEVLREAAVVMVTTPVTHAYNMNNFLAGYLRRCTLAVCMSALDVVQCMRQLEGAGRIVLNTCPPLICALAALEPDHDHDHDHDTAASASAWGLCTVYSAGSAMDPAAARAFRARYGPAVRQNYGTSETGNIAIWRGDDPPPLPPENIDGDGDGDGDGAAYKGVAWGAAGVRVPAAGHVLVASQGEAGEVTAGVPWVSRGYVRRGRLVPHACGGEGGGRYSISIGTGDAGRVVVAGDGAVHVYATRRLRAPLAVARAGLTLLLQADEVEALYARALGLGLGLDSKVAVTQAGGGPLHAHVALGRAPQPGDEAGVREAIARCVGDTHPYALPGRVSVYRELPTSPAGKILLADMATAGSAQ